MSERFLEGCSSVVDRPPYPPMSGGEYCGERMIADT